MYGINIEFMYCYFSMYMGMQKITNVTKVIWAHDGKYDGMLQFSCGDSVWIIFECVEPF